MIKKDKSHPPCPGCSGFRLFDHGKSLPEGWILDYIFVCDVCKRKDHVTGTAQGSMEGRQL